MTAPTDTSERGLEALIVRTMTGRTDVLVPEHLATETSVPVAGGTGWLLGDAAHYDREYCVDLVQLRGFLMATQEDVLESLQLDVDGPTRRKFLARLQGEIAKRGTIDVLRHGIKHGPHQIDVFYGTPSPDNAKATERYARNRFSVTRQLRYSRDEAQRALDMALCYLIQHSAGSGKSNSIAWLAHQTIGLQKDDASIFDSIIVVTDRHAEEQDARDLR